MALRRVISIKYVMKRKLLKRKEKEKKTKGIKRITRGGGGRTKRGLEGRCVKNVHVRRLRLSNKRQ